MPRVMFRRVSMARGSHLLGVYQSLWGPQLFRIECRHRIGKGGPSAITSSVKLPEVALRELQTPIGPARRSPVCTRKSAGWPARSGRRTVSRRHEAERCAPQHHGRPLLWTSLRQVSAPLGAKAHEPSCRASSSKLPHRPVNRGDRGFQLFQIAVYIVNLRNPGRDHHACHGRL
jgi:hypothetical protein